MSYKIFISYERQDSGGWTSLVYDRLKNRYGEGAVFKDEEETPTGTRWANRLERLVKECTAFILVIGPDWDKPRVLTKLSDPNNWVRKEIITALKANKTIFPILIGGASAPKASKLPDELKPAITDTHHFSFHDGTKFFPEDISRLCADIELQTDALPIMFSAQLPTTLYERIMCRLDRHSETGCVEKNFHREGGRLFLAQGAKKAGFRYFAIRCALDVLQVPGGASVLHGSVNKDAQYIINLNWGRFSEPEDPRTRKDMLLKDIADRILPASVVHNAGQSEQQLKQRLRSNLRPMVIYSIAGQRGGEACERAQEWFEIWRTLLAEDRGNNIAVILFIACRNWGWRGSRLARIKQCDSTVQPGLGKLHPDHIENWVSAELQGTVDERLRREVKRVCKQLFRFRRSRHFDDVDDVVSTLWLEADNK